MKKKIVGIFVCMLLVTSVLTIEINSGEESYIKEKIKSIVFSKPDIKEVDQYISVNLKEATSFLMEPGKPVLPIYTEIFKFQFGTKIKNVECTPSQINQKVISRKVQPSPKPVPLVNNADEKNVFEDFIIKDNTVYNSINFYPYKWYDYRVGCGLDDSCHVVFLTVQFYPIQYSPGQDIIQYANMVDIKIEYHEPSQPVVFTDEYDMVIITPSEFSGKFQSFIDYKADCSINTKLVTLDEIYNGEYFPVQGRDNPEKIKYFIKDAIEEWDITYVLLAGGANKVPVRMSFVQDGMEINIISDLYYADIYDASGDFCSWDSNENNFFGEYNYEGTDYVDLYPDVRLGRLNFRELNEIDDVINKIITYESTGAYMEDWFSNFVVCGGDTFSDGSNVDEGEYLNQNAIDIMNDFIPNKIWVTNGKLQFAINIDSALENGSGFLYLSGHGTYESWASHPHNDFETWWPIGTYPYFRVDILSNGEKLPVVIIGGCSNLKFSGDHCFGWSFVKNPNGGGIACYGNSALGWGIPGYGISQGLTGAMELCNFKAYKIQNAKTTGELWVKALNNYLNQFGVSSAYGYKTVEEWTPFNDPSLYIAKVSEKPNKPTSPSGPMSGIIGVEYTYSTKTTDPDGDLIKYYFDWGDNNITWTEWLESGEFASLNHKWEKPGEYKIRVKARDEYGLDTKWTEPLLVTIVSESPYLDIVKIRGGFTKISVDIQNIGLLNATDVNCNISVVGGLLGFINIFSKKTLETLAIEEKKTVTADKIFGIGKINVTVTVNAPLANVATKTAHGFVFGPLVFVRE